MKQKLVRGVIYDDPEIKEMEIINTAARLSRLSETTGDFYEEKVNCPCPNRDEFIMSTTIKAICHPDSGSKNMIIPSSLLDDRLTKALEPIDIGDNLLKAFIEMREEKFLDECEADNEKYEPAFEPANHEMVPLSDKEIADGLCAMLVLGPISDPKFNDFIDKFKRGTISL